MGLKLSLFISLFLVLSTTAASQNLTVSSMRGLDFGDQIFPGIEKSISRTGANAAKFEITGEGGREIQVSFQLPNNLTDSSGNNLAIRFNSTDAAYSTNALGQATAVAFDPSSGVVISLGLDGKLYIWLGGTVTPLTSQAGNIYSGDIMLDVAYTN